ncbi:M20/M25/M40 family metallo-hydrolase [Lentzea sp. NPDC051838]|uniref:M20/M25/M40 family metallo-hydrolase n=1 Tax=Lentzea sp. NPDC051838 TaxID=3154849 RepID=UPI00344497CB
MSPWTRRNFLMSGTAAAALPLSTSDALAELADVDGTDPVALAAAMIRFDTSQSGRGSTDTGTGAVTLPHAQFLERIWQAAGVATEIIPTPQENNVHFLARVKGKGTKPPLLFTAHSDVVTVERDNWTQDPYGGTVSDGWLYGRGAVDMKGAAAVFMAALLRHVKAGTAFDRDVLFLSDCDEEGGSFGAQWLVDNHYDKVRAGTVITEGGWTLAGKDGSTPVLASLTCRDRTSMLVALTARGTATHTSHPDNNQAMPRLGRAVERLRGYRPSIRLTPLSREYFTELAQHTDDRRFAAALRAMLAASSQSELDSAGAEVIRCSTHPWVHQPMLGTTLSFIGLQAGLYTGIIPSRAQAHVRIGFLPDGDDPAKCVADLRKLLVADQVDLTVVGRPGEPENDVINRVRAALARPPSTLDTDVYAMWRKAVSETYPGAGSAPSQFEAATSAGPWRAKGIPVYGLYPYTVDGDTVTRMHGTDERIRTQALVAGTDLVHRMLAQLRVG